MSEDRAKLIETIAEACRIMGALDVTHSSLGHVSYRLDGTDTMLIKGKGPGEVGLRYTQPRDIITVNFEADVVEGADGLQAPSESFLHIWVYKQRPEVKSVIHVHPEHAVLLTICEKEIIPIYGAYGSGARIAVEGVPVYPRSVTISNHQLGKEFATAMGRKDVCLMRGHGVTVAGTGVEDATVRTMALNELVTMTYKAYLLGTPKPILDQDIAEFNRPLDPTRKRGSVGGTSGMLATWRYYQTLARDRA